VVKNRRDWAWKKNYFFDHHWATYGLGSMGIK
jgi:hypothetical protein